MLSRRDLVLAGLALSLGGATTSRRADAGLLARPEGRVILTVTGAIANTNAPGRAAFDRAMLERLGRDTLTTWTPWTEGIVEFAGVYARRLMHEVGAAGEEVLAVALNDFEKAIPLSDFERYDVLLAMHMNGERMRLRDKGPIWIVYPWSDHPELDDLETRGKSVWQLARLVVR